MTKVVHCCKEPFDIYIGRWNPKFPINSKWANPFKIGQDGTREEVIEKYRQYLLSNAELMAALPELIGKTLACWCSPQACHGDILVELSSEYI